MVHLYFYTSPTEALKLRTPSSQTILGSVEYLPPVADTELGSWLYPWRSSVSEL